MRGIFKSWFCKLGRMRPVVVVFVTVSCAMTAVQAQSLSSLWGMSGESWAATGRLPDFATAGYRARDVDIPTPAVVANVRAFGAVGDGVADDSQAFINAIAATRDGALLVPTGRYKITKVLQILKGNVVLRGEGPGKSILYMPQSLTEVASQYGDAAEWPYKGGFVWVEGGQQGVPLTTVSAPAGRGTNQLQVESGSGIRVGQSLRLIQLDDAERGLIKSLQGGIAPQSDEVAYIASDLGNTRKLVDWVFKVTAVDGNTVTLDRPLRVDVKLVWQPQIHTHVPTVQDVGVEGLSFEFAGRAKKAHNTEEGFNAIFFKHVTNAWVRDVDIMDADYGVNARAFVYNSQFEDISMRAVKRNAATESCHHGLNASLLSQDNLFNRLRFSAYCVHDVTVEAFANGNVFANGTFAKVSFDHHKAAPYENLFTNIYTVDGSTLYRWGGAVNRGPQSGVRETFWNISADNTLQALPPVSQFPQMTVIGLKGYAAALGEDRWVEVVEAAGVKPGNLYESQFASRKGVYEAETATISGATARTVKNAPTMRTGGYSGSGFVDFGNPSGDYIEWTVNVPQTGTYKLDIRYANGKPATRTLSLSVNGLVVLPELAFTSTGGWYAWKTKSANVSLPFGRAVKVRVTATGSSGPDVDSLSLSPLP